MIYSEYSNIASDTTLKYCAESLALFTAMSPAPDNTHKDYYDTFIRAWKTAGFWTRTEFILILAAPDNVNNALIWVDDPTKTAIAGSGTFTAYQGYTGNNTDAGRITIGWQGQNKKYVTKDSASLIFYSRTNSQATSIDFTCVESTVAQIYCLVRNTSDQLRTSLMDLTLSTFANTDSTGCFIVVRDGGNKTTYRNANPIATLSVASLDIPENNDFYAIRSTRQFPFIAMTDKLSSAEVTTATNIIEAYMDSLGIGVI